MLDEAIAVAGLPGVVAHEVLPMGQRAVPVEDFDQGAPDGRGQMAPDHLTPFEGQQRAQQHEHNEQQMHQHQPIGRYSVKHGACLL
ncbi:hypothetical protein D3C81_2182490 [compost metagenome]